MTAPDPPTAPKSPTGEAPDRRASVLTRKRVALLIGLAVVATLFLESDALVRRVVVQRADEVAGDCVSLEGLAVDLGPFPATVRAFRGRLDDVAATADIVVIDALRLRDLDVHVERVRFPLTGDAGDVRLDRATATIRVHGPDLARYLRTLDVPGTVTTDASGIQLDIPPLPEPVRLTIEADDGAVRIAPADPALADLFTVSLRVPGVTVNTITASRRGLEVDVNLRGPARRLACDARDTVSEALSSVGG